MNTTDSTTAADRGSECNDLLGQLVNRWRVVSTPGAEPYFERHPEGAWAQREQVDAEIAAAVAAERERCAKVCEQLAAEYIASATENKYLTDHGRALMTSASDWAQTMAGALRAFKA